MTENKKFVWQGKSFDTFQELINYAYAWPDEQVDLDQFEVFLKARLEEARNNKECRGTLTNREAYFLLREHTKWVRRKETK